MSPGGGPVRLIVKSRRVPVALTEIEFPQTTSYGVVSTIKKRSIIYDYVLDEGERRIVEEVSQAAENSGLPLEVVDLGRAGPFSRIVRRLLEGLAERPGLLPRMTRFVGSQGLPRSAVRDHASSHEMGGVKRRSLGRQQACIPRGQSLRTAGPSSPDLPATSTRLPPDLAHPQAQESRVESSSSFLRK